MCAGFSLLYLARMHRFVLLLSLLSTHGVLSGGDAGCGREDFGGLMSGDCILTSIPAVFPGPVVLKVAGGLC